MKKLKLFSAIMAGALVAVTAIAEPVKPVESQAAGKKEVKEASAILLGNQMMVVFMERMKNGNYEEARKIAEGMIQGSEKYISNDKVEFKSFNSLLEMTLYKTLQKRAGVKTEVRWTEQPISDGYYFLAMLDFQTGKHEEALKNLSRAIYWNPVRSAFYSERGYMLLKQKKGPEILMSQIAYQKAAELADNNQDLAAALRGLAFVLVERGRLDVALACLLVSKKYEPGSLDAEQEIAFIRGQAPMLLGALDLAKSEKILADNNIPFKFEPIHVDVFVSLAEIYLNSKEKDTKKAKILLEKALEIDPTNITANNLLKKL